MTLEDVNKLAALARIEMSDAEKQEFLENMESILGYVDQIKNATVDGATPEIGMVRNVMREDDNADESGAFTDRILAEMPDTQDGYLKVKQIL